MDVPPVNEVSTLMPTPPLVTAVTLMTVLTIGVISFTPSEPKPVTFRFIRTMDWLMFEPLESFRKTPLPEPDDGPDTVMFIRVKFTSDVPETALAVVEDC